MIAWAALVAVAVSFAISALLTPLSRRVAARVGYMDIPQRHKAHAKATPLLGGSAIFLAILIPSLMAVVAALALAAMPAPPAWLSAQLAVFVPGAAYKVPQALMILAAAFGMHVLGLVDDRKHLGPWSKLIVQTLLVAAVVIFADVRILTMLDQGALGKAPSMALSILWLLTITNAFNFMDNMDGLSVGVAAICAATLLGAAASIGQVFVSAWLCVILGALLGYWPYNFPPASTFMGDAGSLVIGFLLGVVSCLTTYVHPGAAFGHYAVLAPLVLMAVPLYDTLGVIVLRIRKGLNPMVGDRRHFSHRLLRRGMSVRTAALTIYLCTAGTAIAAALLPRVDTVGAMLVLAQTLAILLIVALLESGGPALDDPKDKP